MTDFTESLAEFRVLTKDDKVMGNGLGTGRGRRPNAFNNLKEFEDFWEVTKKNRKEYDRNREGRNKGIYTKSGIPEKILMKRVDDPKGWARQYAWFKNHPEAPIYAPKCQGSKYLGRKADIAFREKKLEEDMAELEELRRLRDQEA